jgi:ribonuclease HII
VSPVAPSRTPTLRVERSLIREGHTWIAAMDEVGRGALAGPVSVGVVVVDAAVGTVPKGVRDSKLLPAQARERLVPKIRRWAPEWAVGHAGPDEVDAIGIMRALRAAGRRALAQLRIVPDLVLLDGNHDWLTDPAGEGLFALLEDAPTCPPVRTMIKADMRCSSVAAASVLAKVERDAMMTALSPQFPQYAWADNKGYSAPEHVEALRRFGPSPHHRQTWRLPVMGVAPDGDGLFEVPAAGPAVDVEPLAPAELVDLVDAAVMAAAVLGDDGES